MPPRAKTLKRARRDDYEDDDVSDQPVKSSSKSNKKAKTTGPADSGKDADGNSFWSLTGTRRVTVSDFKGKSFVNIREYYTDASGSLKPGKKGIMLSPEQYIKLLEASSAINAELREKGIEIPDISSAPVPKSKPAPEPAEDKDDDEDEDEEEEAPKSPVKSKKAKPQPKKGKKANIEATSDEEDEDED